MGAFDPIYARLEAAIQIDLNGNRSRLCAAAAYELAQAIEAVRGEIPR